MGDESGSFLLTLACSVFGVQPRRSPDSYLFLESTGGAFRTKGREWNTYCRRLMVKGNRERSYIWMRGAATGKSNFT